MDFNTPPFLGEDALAEQHYVSKRSRRQKGILAFLVQDADSRVFCYANADVRKSDQNDEILRFGDSWKERTGALPGELIFDSKCRPTKQSVHLSSRHSGSLLAGIHKKAGCRLTDCRHDERGNGPLFLWRCTELTT